MGRSGGRWEQSEGERRGRREEKKDKCEGTSLNGRGEMAAKRGRLHSFFFEFLLKRIGRHRDGTGARGGLGDKREREMHDEEKESKGKEKRLPGRGG